MIKLSHLCTKLEGDNVQKKNAPFFHLKLFPPPACPALPSCTRVYLVPRYYMATADWRQTGPAAGVLHLGYKQQADMEFVTNFTRIGFWVVNVTPQHIVIHVPFHFKNDIKKLKTISYKLNFISRFVRTATYLIISHLWNFLHLCSFLTMAGWLEPTPNNEPFTGPVMCSAVLCSAVQCNAL